MSQQQRTELRPSLLGRLVERRESPFVCSVHTCVVLNQQGCDVHVLRGRGNREEVSVDDTSNNTGNSGQQHNNTTRQDLYLLCSCCWHWPRTKQRYEEGWGLLCPGRWHQPRAPADTLPPPGCCSQLRRANRINVNILQHFKNSLRNIYQTD